MRRFTVAGAICAAFLFAAMLPVFAQDDHPRDDRDAKQEEHHDDAKRDDQAKRDEHVRRIDDEHFRSHFGHDHHFAIRHVTMVGGRPHFAYGGYNFEIVDPWPAGWAYTDDCYIDYVDGGYFLFDLRHPGVRIAVTVL